MGYHATFFEPVAAGEWRAEVATDNAGILQSFTVTASDYVVEDNSPELMEAFPLRVRTGMFGFFDGRVFPGDGVERASLEACESQALGAHGGMLTAECAMQGAPPPVVAAWGAVHRAANGFWEVYYRCDGPTFWQFTARLQHD